MAKATPVRPCIRLPAQGALIHHPFSSEFCSARAPHQHSSSAPSAAPHRSVPPQSVGNRLGPCSSSYQAYCRLKVLVVALSTEAFQSPSHKSLLAARQATLVLLISYSLPKSSLAAGSGSGIAPYFAVGGAVSRIQSARPDAAPVGVGGWR